MKEFHISKANKYLPVLQECFASDKELLQKWHVMAPSDLETCVRKTFNDLKNEPTLKFFVIECVTEDSDEIVGFFGTARVEEVNFMVSFFIKPKYRTLDTFEYFWNAVYNETGNEYFTAIYEKNSRAKKFLEKNGFELVHKMELENKNSALVYHKN